MLELLGNMTVADYMIIAGLVLVSNGLYEFIKVGFQRIKYGKIEKCTLCDFRIQSNDEKLQNVMMVDHYEKFHPQVAFAARARYGKKED